MPSLAIAALAFLSMWGTHLSAPMRGDDGGIFFTLFHRDWFAALTAIIILLASVPFARFIRLPSVSRCVELVGRNAGAVSLLAIGMAGLGSLLIYRAHPLSMDEYAAVFQGRIFASGAVAGQLPPVLLDRAFAPDMLGVFFAASPETGQVASVYWPGHALLLAPFVALGVPWLLGPVLAGATLFLLAYAARQLFDEVSAPGWVLLLTLASPVFWAYSISFYSMAAHLAFNLAFVCLLFRPTTRRAVLAGVTGSFALVLHNPVPHLLFAVPWIVYFAARKPREVLLPLLLGYVPVTAMLGVGWWLFQLQLGPVAGGLSGVMDGDAPGVARVFGFPGLKAIVARTGELLKLFVWAVPGLPVLALLGLRRARDVVALRLIALSAGLTILGYFFVVFSQGHGWGDRYFHPAWMALPLLAAAALPGTLRDRNRPTADLRRFVFALAILSSTALNLAHARGIRTFMDSHLAQLPEVPAEGRHLVLLDPDSGYYVGDLIQNDPFLDARVIYLRAETGPADSIFVSRVFGKATRIRTTAFAEVWRIDEDAIRQFR